MVNREQIDWEWFEKAESLGHILVRDTDFHNIEDDYIDAFQCDYGFHNGPKCLKCGHIWCMHCTSEDEIKKCKGI